MLKSISHTFHLIRHHFRDVGLSSKRSPKWQTIKKHFLQTNPTCAVCGNNVHLNVHHILPFHLFPELELDVNNLITLCMFRLECHLRIGHGSNYAGFNKNIIRDAAILRKDISKFDIVAARIKRDNQTS